MPSTGESSDLRQALWSVQPYSTIPSWAQVRAYSRRAGHAHSGPWVHVHKVFSQRATKGSGSTRGWQRANTEAVFSSWHCSHMACRERDSSALPKEGTVLSHVPLRMALRETRLSSQDPAGAFYSAKSPRPGSFRIQRWRQQFFCPDLATSLP